VPAVILHGPALTGSAQGISGMDASGTRQGRMHRTVAHVQRKLLEMNCMVVMHMATESGQRQGPGLSVRPTCRY